MQPSGHVGGALVLLAVAMWRLDEPVALGFTAVGLPASLLPDVDAFLPYVVHQGKVHTYAVMFLASVGVGLLSAALYAAVTGAADLEPEDRSVTPERAFALATLALLVGTFTHVTLDVIAYPETLFAPPVEPFWPFTDRVPRVDLFRPNSVVNSLLLALGLGAWLAVYATKR